MKKNYNWLIIKTINIINYNSVQLYSREEINND